jgi:hypothetical protein
MMTPDEIARLESYPPLPEAVRFTKRGYVKKYNSPADEVFGKALSVIKGTGSFVGYELLGKTHVKGLSRPFANSPKHPVSYGDVGWKAPDTTFEVEVEVNSEGPPQSVSSEFVLRFYHPYGTTEPAGESFSDLTGAKARRKFYHLHANAFISEMDSTHAAKVSAHQTLLNKYDPIFHHEAMSKRYRFATRKRRILLISSIAVALFIILVRYLL